MTMITTITLTLTHAKQLRPDILDIVAGRAYNIDGIDDVTASTDSSVAQMSPESLRALSRCMVLLGDVSYDINGVIGAER